MSLITPEKAMAPHSSTLAWKSHGRRSLVGCSPWGRKESNMTEETQQQQHKNIKQLGRVKTESFIFQGHDFHFSLSFIGEGNGNPLQCSCLENPRDRSLVGCHLWRCTELDTTEAT